MIAHTFQVISNAFESLARLAENLFLGVMFSASCFWLAKFRLLLCSLNSEDVHGYRAEASVALQRLSRGRSGESGAFRRHRMSTAICETSFKNAIFKQRPKNAIWVKSTITV
jgi:hypothetical protein